MTLKTPGLPAHTELHREIKTKDLPWFESLYDQYAPALFGLICSRVTDDSDPGEILLNTFRFAWINRAQHDPLQTRAFTWLYLICEREIKKEYSQYKNKSIHHSRI